MINAVTVTNNLGESIKIELRFPEKSGFLIFDVDGLPPPKADINMLRLVAADGSVLNSASVNSRNIILKLVLMESPSVEENRLKTYKYFPIGEEIKLRFETNTRIGETVGIVESNEIAIFSEKETAVISVLCPPSYFEKPTDNVFAFSGITSGFEFPFENASLTLKLLEMSTIDPLTETAVLYEGDAKTGLVIYLHAIGTVVNPKIVDIKTTKSLGINSSRVATITGSGIIAGDDIIISTVRGKKTITLVRSGVSYNILNALEKYATWFELKRGDNLFAFVADSGATNLQVRIETKDLYEGL